MKKINTPLTNEIIADLKVGEEVLLFGTIYTARDQAHLRLCEMIRNGESLPIDLEGIIIYYCGPTPPGDRVIGSCGPTTSSRMDPFTPKVLDAGVKGLVGKGRRSPAVRKAIEQEGAVYFLAPAGAAAYLSTRVKKCDVVAFEDLGPEAIYKLEVEDFPLVVAIDTAGNDIYERKQL